MVALGLVFIAQVCCGVVVYNMGADGCEGSVATVRRTLTLI